MRVLVDARLGWGSGIGRYVANTVPHVARLRPDYSFHLSVMPEDVDTASLAVAGLSNVRVQAIDIAPFSLKEQTELASLAKNYDVTWFTNYWVPFNYRGRYMATVYDILHLRSDLFPASPIKRQLARQVFKRLAKTAGGLVFISRFSYREFIGQFGPVGNYTIAHCGIDHADWPLFDPEHPPLKAKRLLTVGASKAHKNFETLVQAWRAAQVGDDWKLTIISPADKLRSSVDLRAISEQTGRTEILQGVSNADLRALYSEAQIMLTPSLYEGFGLPFMEAMQAGALCISSTADSMVEIGEGAFAWYVNPRDVAGWTNAIERACALFDADKFDFAPIQRHNMRHAAQFNWHSVGQATAAMLDSV